MTPNFPIIDIGIEMREKMQRNADEAKERLLANPPRHPARRKPGEALERFAREQADKLVPEAEIAPAGASLFRLTVIDVEAVHVLDPTIDSGVVRLEAPATELTISRDGRELFRLTPVDGGQPARNLGWDVYAAIIASAGLEDAPEPSTRWEAPARAWAAQALADVPQDMLAVWRREPTARQAQVADRLLRSYLLLAPIVAELCDLQPDELPTRGLWPVGLDAARLDAERAAREEEEAETRAAMEAARIEAMRPKTCSDLGIECVAIAIKHVKMGYAQGLLDIASSGFGPDDMLFLGWKRVEGLELPRDIGPEFRVLEPGDVLPQPLKPVGEPTAYGWAFIRAARAKHGNFDLGPVTTFSEEGLPRARELAGRWGRAFVSDDASQHFRQRWLIEALCRGLLVRPDLTAHLILQAADVAFRAKYDAFQLRLMSPERAVPPSRTAREHVGGLAVAAARGGEISVGALLAPKPEEHKTEVRKGKRG